MGQVIDSFPLFPLGIVLLPEEVVPLHIFEERYKTMIGECIEEERDFGIVWLSDDGLKEIGCTAEIAQLLELMDDGRMNILVRGSAPFRLLRRIEDLPYPAGDIELLEDDGGGAPDQELAAEARERYAELVERATDARPDAEELARLDAYGMAATVEFALGEKQALLEARSENERLRMIGELFVATMKRLDMAERAGERARSNGKVRF
ncbi:MAG: LON peptidase substrate-binding domain-containing protein [Thermoleophilaceae bacterium]